MAFARPKFPVIKEILGLEEWRSKPDALSSLPSGIKLDNRTITIAFTRNIDHPLFRFCLELFSIIPKRCVDPKTNKLLCDQPPSSGYFILKEKGADWALFQLREELSGSKGLPKAKQIKFEYIQPKQIFDKSLTMNRDSVVASNDMLFSENEIAGIKSEYSIVELPKNRFSILLLNPTVAPFDTKECRQIFAAAFRENLVSLGLPRNQLEGSLTPKIFPGYLKLEELAKSSKSHLPEQIENCKVQIAKSQPKWTAYSAARRELPEKALEKTLSDFGVKLTAPEVFTDRSKQNAHFANGESQLFIGSSGLWPQDPYGDLQMFFTPDLHMTLKFTASDSKMQKLIESLRTHGKA